MDNENTGGAAITVFGVGGAGVNSVIRMRQARVPGVRFVTMAASDKRAEGTPHINLLTPQQSLCGCGGDPAVGKSLAQKQQARILEQLNGQDMMILVAGLGRGTGTGAGLVAAHAAHQEGLLTAAVVSMPFGFEGKMRMRTAVQGLALLIETLDCVIVIHNDRLLKCAPRDMSVQEAFLFADATLHKAVQGISDLVAIPGEINIDFADLKTTISNGGRAIIGMGQASGQNRARLALDAALNSPLLDMDIRGARRVLLNVTGGGDLSLHEANLIGAEISQAINQDDTNIIWGTVLDCACRGSVKVTVFATDFVQRIESPRIVSTPIRGV